MRVTSSHENIFWNGRKSRGTKCSVTRFLYIYYYYYVFLLCTHHIFTRENNMLGFTREKITVVRVSFINKLRLYWSQLAFLEIWTSKGYHFRLYHIVIKGNLFFVHALRPRTSSMFSTVTRRSTLRPLETLKWNGLVFHWCFYNEQNITACALVDINFIFSCSTRYLTSERDIELNNRR